MANFPTDFADYTSRDYISYRADMLAMKARLLPEWTSTSPSDFGVVLVELFAYLGDNLSFYGDRIANEAFIQTAVQRSSVLNHAAMLDYKPREALAARVQISFTVRTGEGPVTIPKRTVVSGAGSSGESIIFETDEEVTVVEGNVLVWATQGETVENEPLATSTGVLSQFYPLFRQPVIAGSVIICVNEGTGPVEWTEVDNLLDASGTSPVYTLATGSTGVVFVRFGDNVSGRIPATGASITATYRVGGGERGSIGSDVLTDVPEVIPGIVQITNPLPAVGGTNAESLDDIRRNAPRSLRTLRRAVSLEDYTTLAFQSDLRVQWARAEAATTSNVLIYIAPVEGGLPDQTLKDSVKAYLDERKMVGTVVSIENPAYLDVNIEVEVIVLDQYSQTEVRGRVLSRLRQMLSYRNVGFGTRVPLSVVFATLHGTEGVAYATISVLSSTLTGVGDVVPATNQIPVEGTFTVNTTGGVLGG